MMFGVARMAWRNHCSNVGRTSIMKWQQQGYGVGLCRYSSTVHFDTLKFVRDMEKQGFTTAQAEALMNSLNEVIVANTTHAGTSYFVTKEEKEVLLAQIQSQSGRLALVENENERLRSEVKQIREILNDEITKVKSGVRLDMSLEKGRTKGDIAKLDNHLSQIETKVSNGLAESNSRITAEMATLKLDSLKYLAATGLTCTSLYLTYLRFFH